MVFIGVSDMNQTKSQQNVYYYLATIIIYGR